jgi:hypothetical protein
MSFAWERGSGAESVLCHQLSSAIPGWESPTAVLKISCNTVSPSRMRDMDGTDTISCSSGMPEGKEHIAEAHGARQRKDATGIPPGGRELTPAAQ